MIFQALAWEQLVAVGLLVCLGCMIQGAVGFGFGLFAMPLLIFVGVDLPQAIAIVGSSTVLQLGWACWHRRRDVPWREAGVFGVLVAASVPIGLAGLVLLNESGEAAIKSVVGAALLLAVGLQAVGRIQPRRRVGAGWTLAAASSSGVLHGLVGMGGGPTVLWVMAHAWPAAQARTALWAVLLLAVPAQLLMMGWRFGWPIVEGAALGIALVPLGLAGMAMGMRVGGWLSAAQLRVAAFTLLSMLGVASLIEPWLI